MNTHTLKRTFVAMTGVVIMLAVATACGNDGADTSATTAGSTTTAASDQITVTDVWARPGIAGGSTGIYLSIRGGATADELVGAKAADSFAESVEIHESTVDHENGDDHDMAATSEPGMHTMHEVDAIAVPAGGAVELAPGGFHVMVTGLKADLKAGDTVPITLEFAKAGEIQVTATVREP